MLRNQTENTIFYTLGNMDSTYYLELHISDNLNTDEIKNIIKLICDYINKTLVKKIIYNISMEIVDINIDKQFFTSIMNTAISHISWILDSSGKKEELDSSVSNFLDENREVNLDGLIVFRLSYLVEYIRRFFKIIVSEYTMERGITEFIELLRKYVSSSNYLTDTIDVLCLSNKYKIYYNRNNITVNLYSKFLNENNKDIQCNNFLLFSLIELIPKKIIIHNINNISNKNIISTIKGIFIESVEICEGCNLCSSNVMHINKDKDISDKQLGKKVRTNSDRL